MLYHTQSSQKHRCAILRADARRIGHYPDMVEEPDSYADLPRKNLCRLISEEKAKGKAGKKASYRHLSMKVLGRGDSYIHQYLTQGKPVALDYDDRIKLANYFGVDQSLFAPPDVVAAHMAAHAPAPEQTLSLNRAWLAKAIVKARDAAELWGAEMDADREADLIARAYEKLAREAARNKEDTSKG